MWLVLTPYGPLHELNLAGFSEIVEIIKAVNFLRTFKAPDLNGMLAAELNRFKHEVSNTEKHLKPVIADDGVLIQADDLLNLVVEQEKRDGYSLKQLGLTVTNPDTFNALTRVELVEIVSKLTTERDNAMSALKEKQDDYDQLAAQFQGHRELMERILDKKWDVDDPSEMGREATGHKVISEKAKDIHDHDAHYYASYANHGSSLNAYQI